jgi:hypothetical protein
MGAVLLGLLLAAPAPAPAAPAPEPGWQPPLDLSPAYLYARPLIVPDGAGGFLHSWSEFPPGEDNGRLDVNVVAIPHAGPALVPQKLPSLTFMGVDMASDAKGDAIAAWDDHSSDCCVTLSASFRKPGGPFEAPVAVPYGQGFVDGVRVAMNEADDSVLAYETSNGNNGHRIWAVFRPAGGDFTTPVPVSPLIYPANYQNYDVALTRDGEAIVVWDPPMPTTLCDESSCDSYDYPQVVSAATGTHDGFGEPQVISAPGEHAYTPSLAADAAGDAVVAWQTIPNFDGSGKRTLGAALRRAGEPFGSPVTVASDLDYGPYQDAGIDAAGHALIGYSDAAGGVSVAAADARAGTIAPARPLGTAVGFARVAVAPGGTALLVFETPQFVSNDGISGASTWLAWGDSSGSFGPLRNLTCPAPTWYSLTDAVLADDAGGGILLQYRGEARGDQDDRSAIARSDGALPPNTSGCDDLFGVTTPDAGPGGGGADPPAPPQQPGQGAPPQEPGQAPAGSVPQDGAPRPSAGTPRLSVGIAKPARIDSRGRLRVLVSANASGTLTVTGAVRAGRRLVRLITATTPVSAGVTYVRLRSRGRIGRHGPRMGRAGITARLSTADGGRASARSKSRVRLRSR